MITKRFYIIFFLVMLSTFKIWSSNIYYMDDMFRNILWYTGWSGDGRPFADMYYNILSFNHDLIDIHPMGLILSLAAFSIIMSLYAEKNNIQNNIIYSLSCLTLIINPFFISNLWFRFDGPFMLLSLVMAILPFCINFKNASINYISPVIFIILSLGLYQSSINIFIVFSVIEFLRVLISNNTRDGIMLFLIRAIQAFFALLAYKILVTYFYQIHEYARSYSQISDFNLNGILNIFNNIKNSFSEIKSSFDGLWWFISPTILSSIILIYFSAKKRTITSLTLMLLAILCALISSFGLAVMSKNMLTYPRVFIGAGASLFFFTLFIITSKISNKLKSIIISPLVFIVLVFSFSSNSAIIGEYTDKEKIAKSLVNDIQSKNSTNNRCIIFNNQAKASHAAQLNIKTFPYINKLIPKTFSYGYDGGRFLLMENGMSDVTYPSKDKHESIIYKLKSLSPEIKKDLYEIYAVDDCTIVIFKE